MDKKIFFLQFSTKQINWKQLFFPLYFLSGVFLTAAPAELLVNPGFESGMTGWQISTQYPGIAEVNKNEAQSGKQCLYIENNRGGGPTYLETQKLINVTKGDVLEIKGFAKGQGSVTFTLVAFGDKGGTFGFLQSIWSDDYPMTDDWEEFSWQFDINTEKITMLRFSILLRNHGYKAFIDTFSVKKTTDVSEKNESGLAAEISEISASPAFKPAYGPENMVDKNPDTGWVAADALSFVLAELDKAKMVNGIYWERTGKSVAERALVDYDILYSLDGKEFKTAGQIRGNASIAATNYFAPVNAKFIKLVILVTRQAPASIGEFCVIKGDTLVKNSKAADSGGSILKISKFRSKKILYDFAEQGSLEFVISNKAPKNIEAMAEISERWGLREKRTLLHEKILFPAGKVIIKTISLPVGTEEFGHGLILEIKDLQGKILSKAVDAYEVAHLWGKLSRASSYVNMFSPTAAVSAYDFEIEELRKAYINEIEIFCIAELNSIRHPDGTKERYTSEWYGDVIFSKLKLFVDKCHENGIKVRSYNHMPSANIQHLPDSNVIGYGPYSVQNDKYLSRWSYGQYSWPGASPIPDDELKSDAKTGNEYIFINQLLHKKYFAAAFVKSITAVGWDSIYFDAFFRSFCNPRYLKDKNGNTVTDISQDDIGADLMKYYYTEFRRIKDNFVIFPSINFCGAMEPAAPDFTDDRHEMMAWKNKTEFKKIAEYADVWAIEIHLHEKAKAHSAVAGSRWPTNYQMMQVTFQGLRENANTTVSAVASWTQPGYFSVNQVKPMYAMLLSAGVAIWDYQHGERNEIIDADATQALREYLRFACRYGEYMYGTNIRWPAKDIVNVKAPERLYWKNTYYEKKTPEGKDVYIHLINLPDNHFLWFEDRNIPEIVKNAEITVDSQNGLKTDRIAVLSADNDQEALPVEFTEKNNKVRFVIPEVIYWSLVVVKLNNIK